MNFISIGQYFNKLQSALFLLLIGPLLILTALHVYVRETRPDPGMESVIAISVGVGLEWLGAIVLFNKKIKSIRNAQGLGAKLDKYFGITIVRFSFLSGAGLLTALGFYLSGSGLFTGLYVIGLVLCAILWPSSARVSRDLRLRGDEREMVYYKKDRF